MEISKLDLKSLAVFAVVMRTNNLSVAADQLGMTQPAVSQTVQRLRVHFDDKLFVRTGRGTRPTPRAIELLGPVEEVLQLVRERIDTRADFDPSTARRVFTFIGTDFGTTVFLPKLTAELRRTAPGIRVRAIPANTLTMKANLESGEADLAVGAFSDLIAGFHRRRVYVDRYVCVAGSQFDPPDKRLSRASFKAASHAIVTPLPPGYEAVEQLVREQVDPSQILLEVPSFLSLLCVLRESDFVCVVPKRVGTILAEFAGLAVYPVPFPLNALEVSQFWHGRVHNDPAHRWFRGLFGQLFGSHGPEAIEPPRRA